MGLEIGRRKRQEKHQSRSVDCGRQKDDQFANHAVEAEDELCRNSRRDFENGHFGDHHGRSCIVLSVVSQVGRERGKNFFF